MPVYIALLRGVNVGGKRMKMADLKTVFKNLNFDNVETLLQSGNVVFTSDLTDMTEIAQKIEAGIVAQFEFESRIILRTVDELRETLANSPYQGEGYEGSKSTINFMERAPSQATIDHLLSLHEGPELMDFKGEDMYIYYPEGMGRSKLDRLFTKKNWDIVGTVRNWNTSTKLLALAEKSDS